MKSFNKSVDDNKIEATKLKSQPLDHCTGLVVEDHLSTNTTYPIIYGTSVTVQCASQYSLIGSEVITCEEGIVYSHEYSRPKCVDPGKIHLENCSCNQR